MSQYEKTINNTLNKESIKYIYSFIQYINKKYIDKDVLLDIKVENNEIVLSKDLEDLFLFYYIHEVVQDIPLFILQKNKCLERSYIYFKQQYILKNINIVLTEYKEYKITQGYNEIISLLVFGLNVDKMNELTQQSLDDSQIEESKDKKYIFGFKENFQKSINNEIFEIVKKIQKDMKNKIMTLYSVKS